MMMKGSMMKSILFVLLVLQGAAQSVYKYQFVASASSTYQIPSYPLGTLRQGDNLAIIIQLPMGGAMLLSSYVLISIMDNTNTKTIMTFDDANPQHCNGGTVCTLSWAITATGSYNIRVYSADPNTEQRNLALYYLLVSVNGNVILRVTDSLRQHIIKYFYVAQDYQSVTMTLSPVDNAGRSYFTLLTMSPTSPSGLTVLNSKDLTPNSVSGAVGTFTTTLQTGYYAVVVHTNAPDIVTITTQTDPYPCPYTNNYADLYTVFSGCTRSSTVSAGSGLPCIIYDYNVQACLACLQGYQVAQGTCVSSGKCGARQFWQYGSCYDVSPSCGLFDLITGNCLSCANSDRDMLINGQCIQITSFCKPGYHLVDSRCISDTCATYSKANGQCLSCYSSAYYLSAGQCLPVNCGANKYYSAKAAGCTTVPWACSNFSIMYESCLACSSGYSLYNGVCTVLSNTNNCQLYNFAANICATCNPEYSLLNGACVLGPVCAIGQTLINGVCTLSPASCTQKQVVINSQCVDLPNNCLTLNVYFQCTSCSSNYQLVSGSCQVCNGPNPNFPCLNCPTGMFVDNQGRCQPANQYCGSFNSANGLCLTCANGQQPVMGNCCNTGYSYQNGECLIQQTTSSNGSGGGAIGNNGNTNNNGNGNNGNSGGTGGISSGRKGYGPYCRTINPEQRVCTSCIDGHYFDSEGICV